MVVIEVSNLAEAAFVSLALGGTLIFLLGRYFG